MDQTKARWMRTGGGGAYFVINLRIQTHDLRKRKNTFFMLTSKSSLDFCFANKLEIFPHDDKFKHEISSANGVGLRFKTFTP